VIADASDAAVSFTPTDQGTYTVFFTVTDEFGASHKDLLVVEVSNAPPAITGVSNSGPIDEGSTVVVSVAATDAAAGADPLRYEFDCNNDGAFEVGPQASSSTVCFFADNGTSAVRVRVSDDDGGVATGATSVVVNNLNPIITSASNSGPITEGSSATIFVAAFDPAGASDPLGYEFDCDDDGTYV
jgi:hypothetical protein